MEVYKKDLELKSEIEGSTEPILPSPAKLDFSVCLAILLNLTRASFDIFTFHDESQNDQVEIVQSFIIKLNHWLTRSSAIRLFINDVAQDQLAFLVPKLSIEKVRIKRSAGVVGFKVQ